MQRLSVQERGYYDGYMTLVFDVGEVVQKPEPLALSDALKLSGSGRFSTSMTQYPVSTTPTVSRRAFLKHTGGTDTALEKPQKGTGCRLTKLELYKLRSNSQPVGATSRRNPTRGGRS